MDPCRERSNTVLPALEGSEAPHGTVLLRAHIERTILINS